MYSGCEFELFTSHSALTAAALPWKLSMRLLLL